MRRIPHLMQQHETPRKGNKRNKQEHYTIMHTSCYNKSLINQVDENED